MGPWYHKKKEKKGKNTKRGRREENVTNSAEETLFSKATGHAIYVLCRGCKRTVHILTPQIKNTTRSSGDAIHQLLYRAALAFLQHLETLLTDAQAAEHAAVPDLNVELLTGHARHWTPRVLRHRHRAVLLVAREVDPVQCRRNGFYLRWDKRRGGELLAWQFWH